MNHVTPASIREHVGHQRRLVASGVMPAKDRRTAASIPEWARKALDRYATDRGPVGGFLKAVLENNLTEAVMFADEASLTAIKAIVHYCIWEIPGPCWGSPSKVRAWLDGETS